MVPDTSGSGDPVQVYSTYIQDMASTVYAIKMRMEYGQPVAIGDASMTVELLQLFNS